MAYQREIDKYLAYKKRLISLNVVVRDNTRLLSDDLLLKIKNAITQKINHSNLFDLYSGSTTFTKFQVKSIERYKLSW